MATSGPSDSAALDRRRSQRQSSRRPPPAPAMAQPSAAAAAPSDSAATAQESPRRPRSPEAGPSGEAPRCPTGVFQDSKKLQKMTCGLCPKDADYGVLYFAQSENIAAHENCLLYSAGLVECDDPDPQTRARNFDVESVKKEIHRGRRLKCALCQERGATVGCEERSCNKSYHFFCAKKDHAALQTDGANGTYKLLCQQHAPKSQDGPQRAESPKAKSKRGRKKCLSADTHEQPPARVEADSRHTDAVRKVVLIKKCKEAGLLNDLFEELLDKLHLIQHRLMDGTPSESEYEEIATSLFDCRLFEDILPNFQSAVEKKIHESQERQRQLKELLQHLKDTSGPFQDQDPRSSSSSGSSLSS